VNESGRARDAAVRLGDPITVRLDRERPLDVFMGVPATESALVAVLERMREWMSDQPEVTRVISVAWAGQDRDYSGLGWDRVIRVVYDDEPAPTVHKLFDLWIYSGMIGSGPVRRLARASVRARDRARRGAGAARHRPSGA